MAEELQNLLDRIQKEGFEKAEGEAARVLADARAKAAGIVAKAEADAAAIRRKAEADAEASVARGRRTLEQASRDVVLSVGAALEKLLRAVVLSEVAQSLSQETIRQMLVKVVESYFRGGAGGRVEILLEPEQQEALASFLASRFAEELRKGLTIRPDNLITSGFKVSAKDGVLQHDFTAEAIAESLALVVTPKLASIIRDARSGLPGGA